MKCSARMSPYRVVPLFRADTVEPGVTKYLNRYWCIHCMYHNHMPVFLCNFENASTKTVDVR